MFGVKFPTAALVVGDVLGGDFGAFTATFMMNSQLILIPNAHQNKNTSWYVLL